MMYLIDTNALLWAMEIHILPISFEAVRGVKKLPFHHKDPFDRLIIAQAQADNLIIITKDKEFSTYPVKTLW